MKKSNLLKLTIIISAIIGVVIAINFTFLGDYLKAEKIIEISNNVPSNLNTALIILLIFFVGGALLVPIPLVSFATGIIFGLTKGVLLTLVGLALASISGYLVGKIIGLEAFGEKINDKVDSLKDAIEDKGPIAVAALRVAPTPPFTITSMLAGTLNLNVLKYTIASIIGISPLAFSAIFFGKGAIKLIQEPSSIAITLVISSSILLMLYFVAKNKYRAILE